MSLCYMCPYPFFSGARARRQNSAKLNRVPTALVLGASRREGVLRRGGKVPFKVPVHFQSARVVRAARRLFRFRVTRPIAESHGGVPQIIHLLT